MMKSYQTLLTVLVWLQLLEVNARIEHKRRARRQLNPSDSTSKGSTKSPSSSKGKGSKGSSTSGEGCVRPDDFSDLVIMGDLNFLKGTDQYPFGSRCLDVQNNVDFAQDVLDWADPTSDGSCADLAENGRILFDVSRAGVTTGSNPTGSTTGLIQSYVPAIASVLDDSTIVDMVSSCAVIGSSTPASCESLVDRLDTCNEYKTLAILVPDRVCNGISDVSLLYTETPPYSCAEIQAMRDFVADGGRIVFIVDNDSATARSNVEVNRILDILGSSLDITSMSRTGVPSTVNSSPITDVTGTLCSNTAVVLSANGLDDIAVATFRGTSDPSIAAGNVDRDTEDLSLICTERTCT